MTKLTYEERKDALDRLRIHRGCWKVPFIWNVGDGYYHRIFTELTKEGILNHIIVRKKGVPDKAFFCLHEVDREADRDER